MPSSRDLLRLPIDVLASGADRRWRPDRQAFPLAVSEYGRLHAQALADGNFTSRATALWGLITYGDQALSWARDALTSPDTELVEDAVGVLGWIGVPPDLVAQLMSMSGRLPDSELRDAINVALPVVAAHHAPEDAVPWPTQEGVPLDGALEPFTETIYFLRAPYDVVGAARSRAWGSQEKAYEHRGTLAQLLSLLEPVVHNHFKALVVQCAGEWTAVFDQGADLTNTAHFATLLKTVGVRTQYSPHVRREGRILRYGSTAFWMTDGARKDLGPLCDLRSIQASYQSGWDWQLSGEVQPWEDTERYGRKLVRERFDLALMNRYCRALGIRRDDVAFYGPRATLYVQDTSKWRSKPKGIPSAQWRREHAPA